MTFTVNVAMLDLHRVDIRCHPPASGAKEWFVATGAGNILSTCGKNCHKLEIQDVLPLLVDTARLKEDEFRNFVKCAMVKSWISYNILYKIIS
jgi:hypothetical protein